jgi:hypothetical protein
MGYAAQIAGRMVYPALSHARGAEDEIRRLEKQAMDYPERREAIVAALKGHAYRFKHTASGRAARSAALRISAVTMLEALCEDAD